MFQVPNKEKVMPFHVVVAHLAVIVVPLTALVALAYAVRPAARRGMRWPLVVGGAASITLTIWAADAGDTLWKSLKAAAEARATALPPTVWAHAHGSDVFTVSVVALAILVVGFVWWLLRPGRTQTVWTVIAAVLLGVAAIATLVTTGIVLDQAMTAVWSQHV
jgi:hypothetical protein